MSDSDFPKTQVGIDDLSLYIPSLFLPIRDLADARGIDPAKLEKGLGLTAMAIPDASEDVVTMAAEALIDLVARNDLRPEEIGRIYVGTESMVDGSKPIASYLLGILSEYYQNQGVASERLLHCDVVDITFACIGATDAMLNCLDWIRLKPARKAIVIATDWAKYDLGSPGEYTQGAGAVAMLLTVNPRLMAIDDQMGVATQSEHDFYKPLRLQVDHNDVIHSNGIDATLIGKKVYALHKETPIYDGHFSNQCYTDRVSEALEHFKRNLQDGAHPFQQWSKLIFHLPYAYHARRIFANLFMNYLEDSGYWDNYVSEYNMQEHQANPKDMQKAIAKTLSYQEFIEEKIAPGEQLSSMVGNIYTGSLFLSLVSTLYYDKKTDLSGSTFGFFAYGSGSKSKVFQGSLMPGYRQLVDQMGITDWLERRKPISFYEYEYLHRSKLLTNLDSLSRKVFQVGSGWTETNKYARHYAIMHSDKLVDPSQFNSI